MFCPDPQKLTSQCGRQSAGPCSCSGELRVAPRGCPRFASASVHAGGPWWGWRGAARSFRTPAGGRHCPLRHVTSISGSVTAVPPASSEGGRYVGQQAAFFYKKKEKRTAVEVTCMALLTPQLPQAGRPATPVCRECSQMASLVGQPSVQVERGGFGSKVKDRGVGRGACQRPVAIMLLVPQAGRFPCPKPDSQTARATGLPPAASPGFPSSSPCSVHASSKPGIPFLSTSATTLSCFARSPCLQSCPPRAIPLSGS